MNQENAIRLLNEAIEMGFELFNLADILDISLNHLKQVIDGEEDFSVDTLEIAHYFFLSFPELFN